ncbi:MAG: hypothetical protein IV097_05525 [Burkholderiaceae bacterium]|nr:hypothetical protein [Burkholderiaceae bacterium]
MNTQTPPDESPAPGPKLLPWPILLPLLMLVCLWGMAQNSGAAPTAEKRVRLTVELSVEGQSAWQHAGDSSRSRTQRQYKLVTYLRSDGQLQEFNTKDPQYAQQMMDRAAQVQARVAQHQAKAQGRQAPQATTMQQMAERAQQIKTSCGENKDCLMRAAMELSTVRVLPAGGNAAPLVDTLDTPMEPRYLSYHGFDGCGAQFHEVVNDQAEGQYADVQGPVPWRSTSKADGGLKPDALRLLCLNHSLVLDTKTNTFMTDAGLFVPETSGRHTRIERGRTEAHEGDIQAIASVGNWLAERTRQAPRKGSASVSLPVTSKGQGQVQGTLNLKLNWKLEDV